MSFKGAICDVTNCSFNTNAFPVSSVDGSDLLALKPQRKCRYRDAEINAVNSVTLFDCFVERPESPLKILAPCIKQKERNEIIYKETLDNS